MSHEKTCADYALMKIGVGTSYRGGMPTHIVEHDGRTIFETTNRYEAAMFAAELYAKLERLQLNGNAPRAE